MYDLTQMLLEYNLGQDLAFPRLVSYPRTGSHWFRVMMEKYTGQPSLMRSFYDPTPEKVWGFHIHNRVIGEHEPSEGPTKNLKKVIYLYRNPYDTIFSLLKYERIIPPLWKGAPSQLMSEKVALYAKEYKAHLDRWLTDNDDIENIIYLKYENLKSDRAADEFKKAIEFLDFEWDEAKFHVVYNSTNKKSVKDLTPHDNSVINIEEINSLDMTQKQKQVFRLRYKNEIESIFGSRYFEDL